MVINEKTKHADRARQISGRMNQRLTCPASMVSNVINLVSASAHSHSRAFTFYTQVVHVNQDHQWSCSSKLHQDQVLSQQTLCVSVLTSGWIHGTPKVNLPPSSVSVWKAPLWNPEVKRILCPAFLATWRSSNCISYIGWQEALSVNGCNCCNDVSYLHRDWKRTFQLHHPVLHLAVFELRFASDANKGS